MKRWSVRTRSPEQTRRLGRVLGQFCPERFRIFLAGDLGAGKTCFSQGIGLGLGVPEDEPVTSPSYTLMNHYRGRCDLYHFDLYRLSGPEDLVDLGFDEYAHGEGVTLVEWAERAGDQMEDGLFVRMQCLGEEDREIEFTARGEAALALLERSCQSWNSEEDGV